MTFPETKRISKITANKSKKAKVAGEITKSYKERELSVPVVLESRFKR